MNTEKLKQIAFEIIEKETLPKVDIIFNSPLRGLNKGGSCHRTRKTNKYTQIKIHLIKPKWIPDINGNYLLKGQRVRRGEVGVKHTEEEIIEILAHEIAHLKFWKHNQEHKDYTNKILMKIKEQI